MNMREGLLFDKMSHWDNEPEVAFGGFVKTLEFVELGRRNRQPMPNGVMQDSKPLSRRSVQGYMAMFRKFVRWMRERGLTFSTLTADHLTAFLDTTQEGPDGEPTRALNSEIRTRYIRMIERVYQHLGIRPNPAQQASWALSSVPGARGRDMPKEWLTHAEEASFREALPAGGRPVPGESAKAWRRRRDRAMMAMLIGAGPTVSELIELYIENIGEPDSDGSVPVTIWAPAGSEHGREHVTVLRAKWAHEIMSWLEERRDMVMDSRLLFPATRKGGKVNPATLYRQVSACFGRAEIAVIREGGRTLRNTFAQRELETGATPDELQEYLGLNDARSVERYMEARRAKQIEAGPIPAGRKKGK